MKRRWQDGEVNRPSLCSSFPPSPCLTLSFAANSVVDSRMISGFNRLSHHSGRLRLPVDKENDNASQRSMWQMSIGLVSARELPKRDVLELTQVVCCVSLLEADDADAACAGRCPHDVLHEMNFESEEDAIHEYCTFRTGVHFVTPQFVTKSNESGKNATSSHGGACLSTDPRQMRRFAQTRFRSRLFGNFRISRSPPAAVLSKW